MGRYYSPPVSSPEPLSDPSSAKPPPIWSILTWIGVGAGAILRFVDISKRSLWFDEGYTAWMVSNPAREIIRLVRADTAPPLYYLCLHAWTVLFGHSELALRGMSAFAAALTLALAVPLARRFVQSTPAVAAAVWALALGFHLEYYGQEARFYAVMALLCVAMLQCLQKHLSAENRGWLIPLTLIVAASLYTHNMMVPYIAALAPAWLILPSNHSLKRRVTDGLIVVAGAAILYLPWAITSLPAQLQFIHQGFWLDPLTPGALMDLATWLISVPGYGFWSTLLRIVHVYNNPGSWPGRVGVVIFLFLAAVAVSKSKGKRRREVIGLATFIFFPPLLVIIYSFISTPLLMNKVFLGSAALMPILLMLPLSLEMPGPLRISTRIGAAAILLFAFGTMMTELLGEPKEDWRSAAKFVAELPPRHRLIIFLGDDGQLPFDYYYNRYRGPYRPGEDTTGSPAGFFDRDPPRAMLRVLTIADLQHLQTKIDAGHYEQVVFVESHQQWNDPSNLTLKYLLARFPHQDRVDLYDVSVWWFEN
jgi:4-amino-4-deoxy-L-arabinose transferase-like glycosyltransferase